jgi:UDPglucose 6-dehydrogenase
MQNITIIGSGYIGLVIGSCLAEFGNKIIFADIDEQKIEKLRQGILPIYEPGLEELVNKNLFLSQITCTTDIESAIKKSKIIFIAVNTPTIDGKADISAVKNVSKTIGINSFEDKIICIKSTVPIGTHKVVEDIIKTNNKFYNFDIVSIPEFLREGCAINDFMNPDRIIIGCKSEVVFETIKEIFSGINCQPDKIIWTNNGAAETIKYASNSFLALKISFINEISQLCDAVGVDILSVANGVGLDKRIGSQFLRPGPGFGGSCFPKDVLALLQLAKENQIELKSIKTTLEINDSQKTYILSRFKKLLMT